MKKLFAMLLVLLMVFAAFGCSPAANNGGGDATPPPSGGNEEPPPEETVYDSGVRRAVHRFVRDGMDGYLHDIRAGQRDGLL